VNEDLKGFKTDQKKVISLSKEDQTLKNLFITQDEQEAIEDFEKDKDQQVENELGKKVEASKVARGWNEWAGDGVNEGRFQKRAERAEQVKRDKIEELKKKRADARIKGVILNSVEERDKKFAQKFWVKELPHPFKNVKQFEALMTVPLGKDWNTI
jgi:U3 small nucleolar RNA-associated protein 14